MQRLRDNVTKSAWHPVDASTRVTSRRWFCLGRNTSADFVKSLIGRRRDLQRMYPRKKYVEAKLGEFTHIEFPGSDWRNREALGVRLWNGKHFQRYSKELGRHLWAPLRRPCSGWKRNSLSWSPWLGRPRCTHLDSKTTIHSIFSYICLILFEFVFCSFWIWLCKSIVTWVGSGQGRLRLVQNQWPGCPDVLGMVLTQKCLRNNEKV